MVADGRSNQRNPMSAHSSSARALTETDGGAHPGLRLAPLSKTPRGLAVRNSRSVAQNRAVSQYCATTTGITNSLEDPRGHAVSPRIDHRVDAAADLRPQDAAHSTTAASNQTRLPVEEITRVHLYDSGG